MGLHVIGAGMASSVGLIAVDTAAAVRTGISRFGPIEDFVVFDEDELEWPMTGSPISLLTKGFVQYARWLSMAQFAFKDLLSNSAVSSSSDWSAIPIIWVLPDCQKVFEWPDEAMDGIVNAHLTGQLGRSLGLSLTSPEKGYFCEGPTGGTRALRALSRSFEMGIYSAAVVISVDSLLEPMVMQKLLVEGRIKTPDFPVGLIPGEGATALLLSAKPEVPHTRHPTLATIYHTVHSKLDIDREPKNWRQLNSKDIAQALKESITEVLSVFGDQKFQGDIYIDLNGEEWRAMVWGLAQVKLGTSDKIALAQCREILPVGSWGDIGATGHAAALVLAGRSFVRNYSSTGLALIISISDDGNIGVTLAGKIREI